MFISDTPVDINSGKVDDVLQFVEDSHIQNLPSPRVRLNYVKMLYDVLGFELAPDVALAAVAEPSAELVLSTAGGGKTTWSQIKAIEQKLIRRSRKYPDRKISGDKILCLVYNTHNVQDMKNKHAQMVNRLMAAGVEGLVIDSHINACTMHSFCEFCRKQFVAKLNYVGFSLLTEHEADGMMRRAIKVTCKLEKIAKSENFSAQKLRALYAMKSETMKEVEALRQTDLFVDIDLPVSLIHSIFTKYEEIKRRSRRFEFIDMLFDVYTLLKIDETALQSIQEYFEYVIADEVQDFTPLMWELLKLFVSNGTPLTCIGDEDQNIYSFRGASISDTLHFKDRFEGGKVFTLNENRRCRTRILEEAKRVVSGNTLRFDKEIIGKKEGGEIRLIPYNTLEGQTIQLVRELKKYSPDDLDKSVVCYRNQECSMILTEVMAEEGLVFHCLRANLPYSHELYGHVIGILNALEMPCDRDCYKQLWKVLPCKKTEFLQAIGFNSELNRFTVTDEKKHFVQNHYGSLMNHRGFAEAMNALVIASKSIEQGTLNHIFPMIYKMLCTYYWEYKRSLNDCAEIDDLFERRVLQKFNVQRRYSEVYREIQNVIGICKSNSNVRAGITVSTFHSLKGLEFKHVFATYLDNDIFPNFPLIEYHKYEPGTEKELKEAETRLWYVTVTRAIDTLSIFYYRDNPSKYVMDYKHADNGSATKEKKNKVDKIQEDDTIEMDFLDFDVMSDKSEKTAKEPFRVTQGEMDVLVFDSATTSEQSSFLNSIFKNL